VTTSSAPAWLTAPRALAGGSPAQIYVDLDWLLKAGLWTPLVHYTAEALAAEWGVPRQVAALPLRQLAREGRIRQSPPGYVAAGTRSAAAPAGSPARAPEAQAGQWPCPPTCGVVLSTAPNGGRYVWATLHV
jgi:hypothetical protein